MRLIKDAQSESKQAIIFYDGIIMKRTILWNFPWLVQNGESRFENHMIISWSCVKSESWLSCFLISLLVVCKRTPPTHVVFQYQSWLSNVMNVFLKHDVNSFVIHITHRPTLLHLYYTLSYTLHHMLRFGSVITHLAAHLNYIEESNLSLACLTIYKLTEKQKIIQQSITLLQLT